MHYEVPEYEKCERLTIEKLTCKKRNAEQRDEVTPRVPKAKTAAGPGEPKAKAAARPGEPARRALTRNQKVIIEKAWLSLKQMVDDAEGELAAIDPAQNERDAEISKRLITLLRGE